MPSEASRSRLAWIVVSRVVIGATLLMIRWCTTPFSRARSTNRSRGISASRTSVSASIVSPSSWSVSAAIAPIQVGEFWWPMCSVRPSMTNIDSSEPSSSR